jgi:hypothetical protein
MCKVIDAKSLEPSFQSFLCFQNRERQNEEETRNKDCKEFDFIMLGKVSWNK